MMPLGFLPGSISTVALIVKALPVISGSDALVKVSPSLALFQLIGLAGFVGFFAGRLRLVEG